MKKDTSWTMKLTSALSVQSSGKQRLNFGKCPVPTYKINLHIPRWGVESSEADFEGETKEKRAELLQK